MTQKLTAEKARELRDVITKNAAVIEPTIRDLYIVQALDLALTVLDAQEGAETAGEWIEWKGLLPDISAFVDVKYRSQFIDSQRLAGWVDWRDADIIAYRIIPELAQ